MQLPIQLEETVTCSWFVAACRMGGRSTTLSSLLLLMSWPLQPHHLDLFLTCVMIKISMTLSKQMRQRQEAVVAVSMSRQLFERLALISSFRAVSLVVDTHSWSVLTMKTNMLITISTNSSTRNQDRLAGDVSKSVRQPSLGNEGENRHGISYDMSELAHS